MTFLTESFRSSVLIFCAVVLASVSSYSQSVSTNTDNVEPQTKTEADPNSWNRTPKREPSLLAINAAQRAMLLARGRYFDKLIGSGTPLDEVGGAPTYFNMDRYIPSDPLPIKSSDLVSVATFVDYQPHLSPSKKSTYTDIQFTLNNVLMTKRATIANGTVIDVLLPGGSVLLDSGAEIQYAINEGDEFELVKGHRYLLFCTYDPTLHAYSILKHYDISTEIVAAVDPLERVKARQKRATYAGKATDSLINDAKDAIADNH